MHSQPAKKPISFQNELEDQLRTTTTRFHSASPQLRLADHYLGLGDQEYRGKWNDISDIFRSNRANLEKQKIKRLILRQRRSEILNMARTHKAGSQQLFRP